MRNNRKTLRKNQDSALRTNHSSSETLFKSRQGRDAPQAERSSAAALGAQSSSLQLRIADITLAILSLDPGFRLQVHGATRDFLVQEGIPDFVAGARWDDLSQREMKGKKLFDSGAIWQLYQNKEDYVFSFHSPSLGPLPYKRAEVRKDFTRCEVLFQRTYFNQDEPIYPLEYPLDELLFVHYLSRGRGAEIHSCGVIDSAGRGHLFAGQSEAGKTTMARLWEDEPGVTVLSDDRIILRKLDGALWMYGTPWHGDAALASPARAPLTRVYFLKKGQENELVSLRMAESTGNLISCSFLPFYDPEALSFSLGFFEEVVRTVPCYELRSLPNKSVIEFIRKAVE